MLALHKLAALGFVVAQFAPDVAAAQSQGTLAIIGGRSTDLRGIRSDAITVAPGLTLGTRGERALTLGAHGTRFTGTDAWSAGGGVSAVLRHHFGGGVALTGNAGAGLTTTSFDARFSTLEATPGVEWTWRPLTLYGGARVVEGRTTIETEVGRGPLPPVIRSQTMVRSATGHAVGARLRFVGPTARTGVVAWVRDEPMRVEGVAVRDRVAGVAVVARGVTVSASSGVRSANDERTEYASAGVSLAIAPSVSLEAAGGTYPSDRVTGSAGGRYATLGLTMRTAGARGGRLPQAAGVGAPPPGTTRLSIRARDADAVEVFGDWNGWSPEPARRAPNDVWYVDVRLAPGEYRYAFRVNGAEWRVPQGAVAVADGFGGKSAYVTVRGTTP